MKNNTEKLIDVPVPEETAKLILDRAQPFLEKYNDSERAFSLSPYFKAPNFGLRELVVSVYIQGVRDGMNIKEDD